MPMQLSPEKTYITHIENGFDFLGQNLRRYGRKVLTKPSKKNMHVFLEKVRGAIKRNSTAKQAIDRDTQPVMSSSFAMPTIL
jgi:RNA-directed DNA polymerase